MPRRRKKNRICASNNQLDPELTVHHFANAVRIPMKNPRRPIKEVTNALQKQVSSASGWQKAMENEADWFEKDLNEFEMLSNKETDASDEDDAVSLPPKSSTRTQRCKPCDEAYKVYPSDLWFLVSHYIRPEDVGRFALICHDCNDIIHRAAFWKQLYSRYAAPHVDTMDQEQDVCIDRVHGIRMRVIQALFLLYEPFTMRCTSMLAFQDAPHDLQGYRCLMTWHEPVKNVRNFSFKLIKNTCYRKNYNKRSKRIDLINGYQDVYHNAEDGCCVLQVTCGNFLSLQPVMGLLLTKVFLNTSQNMLFHRLKLVFESHLHHGGSVADGTVLILDPVLNIKVLNWWHNKYPFT